MPGRGKIKSALKVRKDDLRETPPEAVWTLLNYEDLGRSHGAGKAQGPIWEPCAGKGALVKELRDAGHIVAASDLVKYEGSEPGISTGIDFLMECCPPFGCRTIVTNPPFKLADEFVLHGLGLGCRVIVLLRLLALEGVGRSEIIDHHLARVWLGKERLPMMHKPGWEGPRLKQGREPFGWFVFLPTPHSDEDGFTIRRVSWYGNEPLHRIPEEKIVTRHRVENRGRYDRNSGLLPFAAKHEARTEGR